MGCGAKAPYLNFSPSPIQSYALPFSPMLPSALDTRWYRRKRTALQPVPHAQPRLDTVVRTSQKIGFRLHGSGR